MVYMCHHFQQQARPEHFRKCLLLVVFVLEDVCGCVATGSLGTSVFDKDAFLVGASGGVYALLAAHLANILLVSAPTYHHLCQLNWLICYLFTNWLS